MSGDCKISELKKRHLGRCRFILFLEKFIHKDSFEDLSGNILFFKELKCSKFRIVHYTENVVLVKDNFSSILKETHFSQIETEFVSLSDGEKFSAITEDGKEIYGSNIRKHKDFGGTCPMYRQNSSIETLKTNILTPTTTLLLKCKYSGKVVDSHLNYEIDDVVGHKGSYHADMVLHSRSGKELYFSLKHGSSDNSDPDDFQHYTGISKLRTHTEIKNFVDSVVAKLYKNSFPVVYPQRTNYRKNILDLNLKNQAVYGLNYGNSYGLDNVHYVAQGYPTFNISGNTLEIEYERIFKNGEILDGNYEPYLYCRYGSDRCKTNPILQHARFMIAPFYYRHSAIDINNNVSINYSERFFNYDK